MFYLKRMQRSIAMGAVCVMLGISVTGCSGNKADTSQANTESEAVDNGQADSGSEREHAAMTAGKVTDVDGNTITLAMGTMAGGGQRPNGEMPSDGERPGMPEGEVPSDGEMPSMPEGEVPEDGEMPSMPEGEVPSDGERPSMPEGEMPQGGRGGVFEENGETQTITIEDESIIRIRNGRETTQGTLADITVDSILMLEYDDNNHLTSVVVMSAQNGMPASGQSE